MEDFEKNIIEEREYNWKKHFIYNLPEILRHICFLLVGWLVFKMFFIVMVVTAITVTLDFTKSEQVEELIKEVLIQLNNGNI